MEGESSLAHLAPPVFDGDNYQFWAVRMETYLEALDLWEAVEEDYEVQPLPNNPPWLKLNFTRKEKPGRQRPKQLYLLLSHQLFS